MGLADTLGKDDRAEIRTSDLIKLVKKAERCRLLLEAVDAGIPYQDIRRIFGRNDELDEYKNTGLTPDQIHEIDELYAEKCAEVFRLRKEVQEATRGDDE